MIYVYTYSVDEDDIYKEVVYICLFAIDSKTMHPRAKI